MKPEILGAPIVQYHAIKLLFQHETTNSTINQEVLSHDNKLMYTVA